MKIYIFQEQSDVSISGRSVRQLIRDFNRYLGCAADEVSIHFVDKERIVALHLQFFQDPTPTDCISFPLDEQPEHGYRSMGDIFVCPAVAQDYIAKKGGNLYQELTLYLVHGLLHLQGYDDLEMAERRKMRHAEAAYLGHVKEKNLWLFPKNRENGIVAADV